MAVEMRDTAASGDSGSLLGMLRDLLARHGVPESHSADDEGVYLAVESADEVSIRYHDVVDEPSSKAAHALGRNQTGLLMCCHDLARRGYALTLFLSPRTSALHVRTEQRLRPS